MKSIQNASTEVKSMLGIGRKMYSIQLISVFRGGMVQTAEQYEFIHRALALFERSLPDQSGE